MSNRTTEKKPQVNVKLDKPGGTSEWKPIGGSNSDAVNAWFSNLVVNALHIQESEREATATACVQTLVGLNPADEIEGMLCAQLVATNAAALEAMRRGFHPDAMLHSRMDWLNVANKLMRTHAALSETLTRKRTGGQQRIIVEKVQVAPGGQAVIGKVHQSLGEGAHVKRQINPMNTRPKPDASRLLASPRCKAQSKRTKLRCGAPAERGKAVCRFHGARDGAPSGKRNGKYKHGKFMAEAIADRQMMRDLISEARALTQSL